MSELIKREDAIKATWQEPSYTDPINVLTEVRDRINEIPAASPWHRVEEPPKEYGTYIVCWKDGEKFWWEKADWDEDWCTNEPNWYSFRDSRATIIKPDYWMPIEPPKEEEHGN